MSRKFGASTRFSMDIWNDEPVIREHILGMMYSQAKEAVEADGFELLEERGRQLIYQKWVPEWTKVRRRFLFFKRTETSEEGSYQRCKEDAAEYVSVFITWNTTKETYD